MDTQPAICFRFLRLVSKCLACTERLLELSGRSALDRTVQFILREADEHRSNTVVLTQSEAARRSPSAARPSTASSGNSRRSA
jgi:hypothetical protein